MSTVILLQLRVLEIPHEVIEFDFLDTVARKDPEEPKLKRLTALNPLVQFPTLITPGNVEKKGAVMTETAGIIMYINERHGRNTLWGTSTLDPTQLAAFYRWLVFLPANVMPIMIHVEFPKRFVTVPADADPTVKSGSDGMLKWIADEGRKRRAEVWLILEEHLGIGMQSRRDEGKPFLLGTQHPTMLDVYLTLLANWTTNHPRHAWMAEHCPILKSICEKTVAASSILRETFDENECDAFMGKASHAKLLDEIA
ncbi:hypothetical protein FRB96_007793 [Tulasnella sp. 330]|nr:hypothetical protein FRB96_007793 [Tulasnella sp. 330]KAG8874458.1 hypothetical protein FRB97_005900 [Tulasnella sp. 331]KAG8885761.1 hypothetical protein FRB98_001625 [Tulasnella sp. 332]